MQSELLCLLYFTMNNTYYESCVGECNDYSYL